MTVKMRVRIAATWRDRLRGLLGQAKSDEALLLAPCRSIHTFGMRYPIDVAFIDERGRVLAAFRSVGPGRVLRFRGSYAVVERASDRGRWVFPGDVFGAGVVACAGKRNLKDERIRS